MSDCEQELKIRIAQKVAPLHATISALKKEISGLSEHRKKQTKEINKLRSEIECKDEALKKIGNIIANQQADAGSYFLHGDMRHVDVQYIHRLAKEARSTEGINDE